jgi:signal transduction histidine kinase/DNA-binding NarL/FixJ family response regulator
VKDSLRDFRDRLSFSIGLATLLMGATFVLAFQALIYSLITSRLEVSQIEFDRMIEQEISSLESQVAIVAGNAEFRTFIRSGAATRQEQNAAFLELIASLRREGVKGVEISLNRGNEVISFLGEKAPSVVSFDVCYVGDRLNGNYGDCTAVVNIFLEKTEYFSSLFHDRKLNALCNGCGKPLGNWKTKGNLLRLGAATNITIDLAPKPPTVLGLESVCLMLAGLIVGYGIWVWRRIGVDITEKIVKPMNSLVRSMESGDFKEMSLDDSFSEIVSIQNHHAAVAAVARMTQMLAHDVRKPFSLLRMALGMLAQAKDPAAVEHLMSRIVPEIDKAMSSVDGMISDVMEVGSASATLIQEPASPESLIEATLGEIIRIYPRAVISFDYDLKHKHMAHIHVQKIGRVFSNVVGNAFQAMRIKGCMWFQTTERDGMIQFCVGNAGSVIPQESLSKLFEAFFTSGKKGGTGLGLAIAQKVVNAHGGKIWCESCKTAEHPDGKVEFFFTLPISAGSLNKTTAVLPKNSTDIAKDLVFLDENSSPSLSVDKGELNLEDDIVHALTAAARTLHVLIVDDEAIYRSGLSTFLNRTEALAGLLAITLAQDSDDALRALSSKTYDLVITDVDLGAASLNGFDLVLELRKKGSKALVCVHSNRIVAADSKTAIEAGADYFMPKPMARAQLLRILSQAAASQANLTSSIQLGKANAVITVAPEPISTKPAVLVIDDSPMTLDAWAEMLAPDAEVFTMISFEDLTEKIESDPNFVSQLTYVITDMHLDGSAGNGQDIGRLLKGIRSDLPVLMSSDDTFEAQDLVGVADKVIPKEPVDLAELRKRSGVRKK